MKLYAFPPRDTTHFDAAPSFDAVEGIALSWSRPAPSHSGLFNFRCHIWISTED